MLLLLISAEAAEVAAAAAAVVTMCMALTEFAGEDNVDKRTLALLLENPNPFEADMVGVTALKDARHARGSFPAVEDMGTEQTRAAGLPRSAEALLLRLRGDTQSPLKDTLLLVDEFEPADWTLSTDFGKETLEVAEAAEDFRPLNSAS